MFPERFNNKTNGVTPRRWLRLANPALARLITDALGGEAWVTDLESPARRSLRSPTTRRSASGSAPPNARRRRASPTGSARRSGLAVDPDSIFDSQIKRIHEYKRQLLNVLHIVILYNRLRANPNLEAAPRTFFFAGKAAPAYRLAKLIIKLINNVAGTIDGDPAVQGRLRVLFLPEYNVSLAERLIPASDVSEQISTAGYEASGTGNMKFMMNGALTVGTRDGATIEMAARGGRGELLPLRADRRRRSPAGRDVDDPLRHYREDAGDARGARPDLRGSLQPVRARRLRADPRDAADGRRPLPASRRPSRLRGGSGAGRDDLGGSGRLVREGHPQRRGLGAVLERPDDHGVCEGHLGRRAVPGDVVSWGVTCRSSQAEATEPTKTAAGSRGRFLPRACGRSPRRAGAG